MPLCHRVIMLSTLLLASFSVLASKQEAQELVENFYTSAFVEHNIVDAAERYIDEDYIQHNPYLANGKKPLVDFFSGYLKNNSGLKVQIKRILVDKDLVVVHSHWQLSENDNGSAVMDIFRVSEDKIVEHWDVVQKIPAKSANGNTMF